MTTVAIGYEELSRRLGITIYSARRITNRHRWHRTRGNDGHTLVHVPVEYLERRGADDEKPVHRTDLRTVRQTVIETELLAKLMELQAEMAAQAQRLGAAESRADAAEALVSELRADRDRWHQAAERLASASSAADREAERARNEAEQLRTELAASKAEFATYRSRPWWRRAFG